MLDHVILIYIPHILIEGIYRSILILKNIYYKRTLPYGNISKKKIHKVDVIKVLVMVFFNAMIGRGTIVR